jgi:hypothetical protein
METKAVIRWIWELERKYNNGKTYAFFQDLKQDMDKEIEDAETNGMFYESYQSLCDLRKQLI